MRPARNRPRNSKLPNCDYGQEVHFDGARDEDAILIVRRAGNRDAAEVQIAKCP